MKITVMGLGAMGSSLATCLLENDQEVTVWNRSSEKAARFKSLGARVASTPNDAIKDSDLVIVCIKSHRETIELLEPLGISLAGKTICDLSTGDDSEANCLVELLNRVGSSCLVGMINAYPSGIGKSDTTILVAGSADAWSNYSAIIKILGASSDYIGPEPAALAAMFAGLFTVRQGFMFGMVYGALVCREAGVSMQAFSDQIPASIKLVHDYYDVFSRTVPNGNYDNAEATLDVYARAQADALETFERLGAAPEFMKLIHDRTSEAQKAGFGNKQLTSMVDFLK